MELQFQKKQLPCIRQLACQCRQQELTQEVHLADGMPDIGRVIGTWGQILIRGKEWRQDSVSVSGGVMAWTIYVPDTEDTYKVVESWVPFTEKVIIPDTDKDGTITAIGSICYQDARSVSARKIMLRIGIFTDIRAHCSSDCDLYEPGELPNHIMVKLSDRFVKCPAEIGEKLFTLEDRLPTPDNSAEIKRIVRYSVEPQILENKVLGRRLVFRGNALTHIMYEDAGGLLNSLDIDIPFSQFTELDYDYEEGAEAAVWPVITNAEIELGDDKMPAMKLGMSGQYITYIKKKISIVDDAYSVRCDTFLHKDKLQLPVIDHEDTQKIRAEISSDLRTDRIVDATFLTGGYLNDTKERLTGRFYILFYDADGNLQNAHLKWEHPMTDDEIDGLSRTITIAPSGKVQTKSDLMLSAQTELRITSVYQSSQGVEMVSAIELNERNGKEDKPSAVLKRSSVNDLWLVAKDNCSSIEQICTANPNLECSDENRVLIIPVL